MRDNNKIYEVEIKARIDQGEYKRLCKYLNPFFINASIYEDAYYDNKSGLLAEDERELRIRKIKTQNNTKCLLTYKDKPFDERTKSKPEYEVEVENAEVMKAIITKLGYVEKVDLTKECINYELQKSRYKLKITLVYIKRIKQYFVEIEVPEKDKSRISMANAILYECLNELMVDQSKLTNIYYTDLIKNQ